MPVGDVSWWELVAITFMRGATVLLAFAALWSLRRTDAVVLKARIYLNRGKVSSGLLFLGLGMGVFLLQALLDLAYLAWEGDRLPLDVTGALFLVALVLLVKGFHSFYSLSRPPAPSSEKAKEGG